MKDNSRIFLYMKYVSVRIMRFYPSSNRLMGDALEQVKDAKNGGTTTTRRGRLGIMAEILDAAVDGNLKTRIMYTANVNFVQFNEYLKCLLEARLMRTVRRGGRTVYETTEKGKLLLRRFNETEEMIYAEIGGESDKPLIIKKRSMIYVVKK